MSTRRERIVVVVDAAHRSAIETVSHRLRAEGMQVEQVLRGLGTITGTVPESRLAAVERLEGVASVERQHHFRLPPPDAPVQ